MYDAHAVIAKIARTCTSFLLLPLSISPNDSLGRIIHVVHVFTDSHFLLQLWFQGKFRT